MSPTPVTFSMPTAPAVYTWEATNEAVADKYGVGERVGQGGMGIVFLAREIVMAWRGQPGLTERMPWIVAFVFGLAHGLGFAGALAEIGLPQQAIPLALLCFNVGVEIGQLIFVAAVLALAFALRRWMAQGTGWFRWVAPCAIGGVAALWMVERVAAFWV